MNQQTLLTSDVMPITVSAWLRLNTGENHEHLLVFRVSCVVLSLKQYITSIKRLRCNIGQVLDETFSTYENKFETMQ